MVVLLTTCTYLGPGSGCLLVDSNVQLSLIHLGYSLPQILFGMAVSNTLLEISSDNDGPVCT